ncbi:MAG TPA: hypothetical protein VE978_21850 [Chitinophagales bacterium]|nr:hypothetical protein [Chitinophagales bacterium]
MTFPGTKRIWIGIGVAAAVIIVIVFLFLHNRALNMAISKLDSAMMRLDTAQVRIDSSQKTINAMQSELSEYQKTIRHLDTTVMILDIHSRQKEQQFNRTIQGFSSDYAKLKKNFQEHQRTYWPRVTIDTSTKQ